MAWQTVVIDQREVFKVPAHLQFIKKTGCGPHGVEASFRDVKTDTKVSVTKTTRAFEDLADGQAILNEVKLLQRLRHENVIGIIDIWPPPSPDFEDIYVVKEFMDTDLHRVIISPSLLSGEHHQYFSYQILRALVYLHSAEIVHGDLKPHNILLNKECDLKISGFAHTLHRLNKCDGDSDDESVVCCRWYGSPESFLNRSHAPALKFCADIWAVGCILCELFGRKPLFMGHDILDQVKKIIRIVGTPSEEDLEWLPKRTPARCFMETLPRAEKQSWSEIYPNATVDGIDALEEMLRFCPMKRITAGSALTLPYFAALHMPDDDPTAEEPINCSFARSTSKSCLQKHAYVECWKLHPEIEQRDEAMLHNLGIDVLLDAERGLQPTILTLHNVPTGEDSNILQVTFTNLAGSERASLCVDAREITIRQLRRKVNEQIEKASRLVLPCGEMLTNYHEAMLLADVLHCTAEAIVAVDT